ncbi:MAG: IPT/TIG domain-containing protein [Planctomycetes bacterium]|nr:IPT/TIG domain-containing protein [Planctomycetota bacterium]
MSHVRLHNPSNGTELYWQSPGSISIVIQDQGSDDIPNAGHVPALRMAIDEWNDVAGTNAQLIEDSSSNARARVDWSSSTLHTMLFDETNSSGYFPIGSGTVAITPVSFFSNGRISDADVLFNGTGFSFTTSDEPGAFDVADVATHELGHLLGLDHSGSAGATMYPYVSTDVSLHRSLALDDAIGLRSTYSSTSFGSISGTVRRSSDNSAVAGAFVVARDDAGRAVASALAESNGTFVVRGLESGDYTLYAVPLDSPVSSLNLTSGHSVSTNFQPIVGSAVTVTAGSTAAYGTLLVGADANLALGRNYDDFPVRVRAGQSTMVSLHGVGLGAGCILESSDPLVGVSPVSWIGSTQVLFTVSVPANAEPGHVDLSVDDGDVSILVGALEITPDDPTVTLVTPAVGHTAGGDALTITGSGFRAGARVVIGDQLYEDGDTSGCTVVDDTTITLTTRSTEEVGTFDVVVIDESGVEGRAGSAFTIPSAPTIDLVYPAVGSDMGGTLIAITGSGFSDPMSVRIDGVAQPNVTLQDSSTLYVVTEAGTLGAGLVLEVEDGDGDLASAAFSYVDQADPTVGDISPSSGAKSGGTLVTISGAGFPADVAVIFGADPRTGSGGTPGNSVTWIDSNTITVRSPAHSSGAVSIVVSAPTTGQASAIAAAFTYQAEDDSGGGGGCAAVIAGPPSSWRSVLSGAGWIPLALLAQLLLQRRARACVVRVR